jgi:hypothetical protein
LKAAICPFEGQGFDEHVPMATQKALLLDGELWNMFPQQRI